MKFLFFIMAVLMSINTAIAAGKPNVNITIGFGPGGATDFQARTIQKLIQAADPSINVVINYKPGAGGVLGVNYFVNKSVQPDTVELFVDASNILITRFVTQTHTVDFNKDIKILLPIGHTQMLVLAPKQLNYTSINDYKRQASINYASSGVGSTSHFTSAYLQNYLNNEFVHIPYKSSAVVYPDLITGRVDLFSSLFSDAVSRVEAGDVTAVGITGTKRNPRLPNVPTLNEQGLKNYPIDPWFAIFYHPGNNPAHVEQIKNLLVKLLKTESVQKEWLFNGLAITETGIKDPDRWLAQQINIYKQLATFPSFSNLKQN